MSNWLFDEDLYPLSKLGNALQWGHGRLDGLNFSEMSRKPNLLGVGLACKIARSSRVVHPDNQ